MRKLIRDERGQDFVEYALLMAFAAAAVATAFPAILATSNFLTQLNAALTNLLIVAAN